MKRKSGRSRHGVTTEDLLRVTAAAIEDGNGREAILVFTDRIPSELWIDIFCELCDLAIY